MIDYEYEDIDIEGDMDFGEENIYITLYLPVNIEGVGKIHHEISFKEGIIFDTMIKSLHTYYGITQDKLFITYPLIELNIIVRVTKR